MASSDIKHDYNMEAGLLSTLGEERMLTKEAQFQDSELANSRDNTRTTSCARRALIALAVVCLVGVGLVSLGGGVCPGHLRHAVNGEISVKDAIHSHKPNLSDSMAQLARRQDNLTPGASSNTGSGDSSTEPTAGPTDASTTDQPSDTAAQTTSTQPEASQTSDTNQPSSTAAQESTSQEASTSSNDTPSSTEQPSSDASTSNAPSSTAAETTAESRSSSQAESTTDSADQASSTTSDSTKERTITTGTRTTSSAVKKTFTTTLENGGITTLTSTSWVAVVPNSQSTSASDASLQNAASQSSVSGVLSAVISMMFGGLLLL